MNEKKFMISLPDEKMYIGISNEMVRKHGFNIRDACQAILLEYCFDPEGRTTIDNILSRRAQMRKE